MELSLDEVMIAADNKGIVGNGVVEVLENLKAELEDKLANFPVYSENSDIDPVKLEKEYEALDLLLHNTLLHLHKVKGN
jgi:hypothetical protein